MVCCHSLGCKAPKTKIMRIKSTLDGAIFGGRWAEVMSHWAADILPAGGEEYKGWDFWGSTSVKERTQGVYLLTWTSFTARGEKSQAITERSGFWFELKKGKMVFPTPSNWWDEKRKSTTIVLPHPTSKIVTGPACSEKSVHWSSARLWDSCCPYIWFSSRNQLGKLEM